MWDWKPNWWQTILLFIAVILSTVLCFPCWLLQKIGLKSKRYAKWLCTTGIEQLSYFEIREYKI